MPVKVYAIVFIVSTVIGFLLTKGFSERYAIYDKTFYNEMTEKQLEILETKYILANDIEKDAMRPVVIQAFSSHDVMVMSEHLKKFYIAIRLYKPQTEL